MADLWRGVRNWSVCDTAHRCNVLGAHSAPITLAWALGDGDAIHTLYPSHTALTACSPWVVPTCAYAQAGCKCKIYIHAHVTQGRADAMAAYGADIIRVPGNYEASLAACKADAQQHDWQVQVGSPPAVLTVQVSQG